MQSKWDPQPSFSVWRALLPKVQLSMGRQMRPRLKTNVGRLQTERALWKSLFMTRTVPPRHLSACSGRICAGSRCGHKCGRGQAFPSEDSFKPRLPRTPHRPSRSLQSACCAPGQACTVDPIRLRETTGLKACTELAVSALITAVLFLRVQFLGLADTLRLTRTYLHHHLKVHASLSQALDSWC